MFDPRRFARLARAHWSESWRTYAWFLAAGMVLHLVISIICFAGPQGFRAFDTRGQTAFYFLGLFVLGPIFAGRHFQSMSTRASALLALMRPASAFEKWLLAVLTVVIAYPLAYTLAFYLIDVPDQWLASGQAMHQELLHPLPARHGHALTAWKPDYSLVTPWTLFESWRGAAGIFLLVGSLQGMALFGSLWFRRAPFIKTVLSCVLLLLAGTLLCDVFDGHSELVLGYWEHPHRPLSTLQAVAYPALWIAFPALFWLAGFLALKEREISA